MNVQRFQTQGSPRWEELTDLLDQIERRPKGLSYEQVQAAARLHSSTCADYAYASTHFPQLGLTRKLAALCTRGHRLLSVDDDGGLHKVRRFFTTDYPRLFRRMAPVRRLALALFVLMTIAGAAMGWLSDGFAELFIGAEAMDGLRRGVIWTDNVAANEAGSLLSTSIFTNNVGVMFKGWAGGVLLGIGSLYALIFNSLMFGAILPVTARYGLFERLLDWIAAHGPLELYLITVSCAAGLWMGRGIWVASTEPRGTVMARHGRESILLMLGAAPWMVLLGFVEGYVSPVMTMPLPAKLLIGVALLTAFLAWTTLAGRDPAPEETP